MKLRFLKIAFLASLTLFALSLPTPSVQAAPADLVITEIMYNPEGADTEGKVSKGTYYSYEWLEIYNTSGQAIDLTDWRFNDGKNHILNAPPEKGGQGSIVIQPGEYAILANDAATFLADHPGFSGTVIDTVMSLNNTSDTLSLIDPNGSIINFITYQNSWGGNENGKSLEKIDIAGSNTASNWGESQIIGGTPGAINSISGQQIPPEPVCTTEICDGIDNDCDGFIDEDLGVITCGVGTCEVTVESCTNGVAQTCTPSAPTIEICDQIDNDCNGQIDEGGVCEVPEPPTSQTEPIIYPLNIFINEFLPSPEGPDSEEEFIEFYNGNGVLVDLSGWIVKDTQGSTKSYIFPDGADIQGYGFLVLDRPTSKIVLNNDGEGLILKNPLGSVVDSVLYEGKAPEGQSYAKKFDGTWEWTLVLTAGEENRFSAPVETKSESESEPEILTGPEAGLETQEESQSSAAPSPAEISEDKPQPKPIIYPFGILVNEILPSPTGPDAEEEWTVPTKLPILSAYL